MKNIDRHVMTFTYVYYLGRSFNAWMKLTGLRKLELERSESVEDNISSLLGAPWFSQAVTLSQLCALDDVDSVK